MRRTDARRSWERRRRPSRSIPWRRRADPPDDPPLAARDRAAIEAIRRELDLEYGQFVAQDVENPDEPRARRPWAFVVTLSILVLAVAAVVGVALHGRRPSSPEVANRTAPPPVTPPAPPTPALAPKPPPVAVAPAMPPPAPATPSPTETPSSPPASEPSAPPGLPKGPALPRSSEPKAPAEPPATAAVGDAASEPAGSDDEKDASAEDDGAKVVDSPPPLPKDRRPARSREMPPRVQEGPVRAELPPLDYSKRRPSLPPPSARTD